MRVGLFIPCYVDSFYREVGIATVQILEHLGIYPEYPLAQTCCGQVHYNAGYHEHAKELAQRFCEVFAPFDATVTPSGSCASMVRHHYPTLIGPCPVSSRVFEFGEFLVDRLGHVEFDARLEGRAMIQIGCHTRRELAAGQAAMTLLKHVKGLEVVPTPADEGCCGFGGTFSIRFPEVSVAMGKRKLEAARDADVDFVISTDASCMMHLQGMLDRDKVKRPRLLHIAEVLATGLGS